MFSLRENDARIRLTWPSRSEAVFWEKSSPSEKKIRERSVCSSARHASPSPRTAFSDVIDCVATIGMQRDWRVSANAFSSPPGSSSPLVTKAWYSSQTKTAGRQ